MRVVQINAICSASTGKIAVDISKLLDENGIENYIFHTMGKVDFKNAVNYASKWEIKANALLSKLTGRYGFHSVLLTRRLIRKLKEIKPDVVQLHNIHSHNVHLGMLFKYLKKEGIKIFWSMHDCWAFTAYCPHFAYAGCDKWEKGCHNCRQRRRFSYLFDRSRSIYKWKKELFQGLPLTVITATQWLGDLVKQSFFGEYPVKLIPYGINLDLFKPTETDFRKKYGLEDKKIWLSVAMGMGERKGFAYYLKLAELLEEDTRLVLVGVTKEQIASLPENIIGITRTENQKELAGIYTAADVFVNCTLEEVMGLVNIEALACGTPVVTFDTGGSPECIDETCGSVVPQKDVSKMYTEAKKWAETDCAAAARARAERLYKAENQFLEYINLYKGR